MHLCEGRAPPRSARDPRGANAQPGSLHERPHRPEGAAAGGCQLTNSPQPILLKCRLRAATARPSQSPIQRTEERRHLQKKKKKKRVVILSWRLPCFSLPDTMHSGTDMSVPFGSTTGKLRTERALLPKHVHVGVCDVELVLLPSPFCLLSCCFLFFGST